MLHLILSYIHSRIYIYICIYSIYLVCLSYVQYGRIVGAPTSSARQRSGRPWNGIALNAICPIFRHRYLSVPPHCKLNPRACATVPLRLFQYPDDAYCCDVWHLKPAKGFASYYSWG